MKIVLDVQHMGKPDNPLDRGAKHLGYESDYCLDYAVTTHKALTLLGYIPYLITYGTYNERAEFANKINCDLYLACHLNSFDPPPKSNYSLVEISEFSGGITKKFAQYLLNSFNGRLPVKDAKIKVIKKNDRGFSCISHVRAPALLIEPFFINHQDSINVLRNKSLCISNAIVYAIRTFGWNK